MSYLKGWRTLAINIGLAVLALMQQADWVQLVPMQDVGYAVAGVNGINLFLRMITNTAVGSKQ